jgi:hypothetical protein
MDSVISNALFKELAKKLNGLKEQVRRFNQIIQL